MRICSSLTPAGTAQVEWYLCEQMYLCQGILSPMAYSGPARWPVWALVREARRRAGLTQAELARRAHTSQSSIAAYERARTMPDLATLFRLVEACGLELRLELAEPDPQRVASERAARGRSVEQRLATNESFTELAAELRSG